MVICVPSGITGVEQRAVQDAAEYAGARKPVHIIEEPMAAAIGADLPVHEPTGNMIVDIGGGTTEVAVISLGGIVTAQSVRVAGDELDDAIMQYVKKEFSLAIGDRTAEEIKIHDGLGLAAGGGAHRRHPRPRPRHRPAAHDPAHHRARPRGARRAGRRPSSTPSRPRSTRRRPSWPPTSWRTGITLTGGGALLGGLDQRLAHETGMPIHIAHEPLYSVVIGSGRALEEFDALRGVLVPRPGAVRSAHSEVTWPLFPSADAVSSSSSSSPRWSC